MLTIVAKVLNTESSGPLWYRVPLHRLSSSATIRGLSGQCSQKRPPLMWIVVPVT